jgi:hypothetical protein
VKKVLAKMEWTITLNEEKQYVEIVTSGIADKEGSLRMAKAISTALRKMKIEKVLIDHRNVSEASGGTLEIYQRPMDFKEMGIVPNVRIAEVVKPEHKEVFSFLETVCVNFGYIFSIFHDRNSALEWLIKS